LYHPHDRVADSGECSGLQLSGLSGNEAGVGGEKLARARVTGQAERAAHEIGGIQRNSPAVAVRLACYLAENPIATSGIRKHHRRAQLGRGEIGEGKNEL
jgi:hypothetical protein